MQPDRHSPIEIINRMAQRRWIYFSTFSLITIVGSVSFLSDYYYVLITNFQRRFKKDSSFMASVRNVNFYKKNLTYNTDSDETLKSTPKFRGLHRHVDNNELPLNKDDNVKVSVYTDRTFPVQDSNTAHVNCRLIFEGDREEMNKAINRSKTESRLADATDYVNFTKNCSSFITKRGYIMSSLTTLEDLFPIAYSIIMYKDVEQVERLIRAIYRPQNIYCIHVDKKSSNATFKAIESISSCFPNILMAPKRVTVRWGQYSVLESELICMEELLKRNKKWKYFINLTGQEFPLRTNYELVRILTAYDGANDMSGTVLRANKDRWSKLPPPPHNLTAVKGGVHIAANREFVDFAIHNQKAKDLLEWIKNASVPDEGFFQTLNHNPSLHIRGSYLGFPEKDRSDKKPCLVRFKNWGSFPCHGHSVRGICHFGVGDLPLLSTRPELFANKFSWNFQRYAFKCMEELHFNRTRDSFRGNQSFNTTFYAQQMFVRKKIQ